MNKPTIELKAIKHSQTLSRETHAYTATIYVDGKRWGAVLNDGGGGSDYVSPLAGGYGTTKELEDRIKATYGKSKPCNLFPEGMEQTLETVCGDLVNEFLFVRDWRRKLKGQLVAIKGAAIFAWPKKLKPTLTNIESFKKKNTGYKLLNELPEDEAFRLIREAEDCPQGEGDDE
jgi:hypothetical protein